MNRLSALRAAAWTCALLGPWAHAQTAAAIPPVSTAPVPTTAPSTAALSTAPYPGVITLQVDVSDLDRKIFRVKESLPVRPGELTLRYPQWLPGNHAPIGKIVQLAGLKISANGQPVAWRRDSVDMFAFHLRVPDGAGTLEIEFEHLSPLDDDAGRVVSTPEMVNLQWNAALLYPAGHAVRGISVKPTLRLPEGFAYASALDVAAQSGATVEFKPVDADTLVDSPVYAGRHFKRFDLDPDAAKAGRPPVVLSVVADETKDLEVKPELVAIHRALVGQADKLFGARHFPRYEFLLALSDELGGIGLEHHASSENSWAPGYFTDWAKGAYGRDLLAHEYTHSWNGKFRRPADLWTPDFNQPQRTSLLWVYEGMTQYWGYVLAARAGLVPQLESREEFANVAASLVEEPGREWRNLQDTTNEPVMSSRGEPHQWRDWQRTADYYTEMVLVWLEADMLIRERSQGRRSLDDFARAFFGPSKERAPTETTPLTYTVDDVVAELNRVQPYDWAGFLRERLDTHRPDLLLRGLERSGWRLAWTEQPSEYYKLVMAGFRHKSDDFHYSLGFDVKEGRLKNVRWGSPAFRAGLSEACQLLAVNGRAYKPELLGAAITQAKTDQQPIQLLVKVGELYKTVPVSYSGGLRYPTLQRIDGTEDRLQLVLKARP